MRKIPIVLATLTVVSSLGTAAMTLPASATHIVSVSDINYNFTEKPYDFTRIDYEAGTINLRFNPEDDKGLSFRKIVFADFNFEKYDTGQLNQRVSELREANDPEWVLNVVREGEVAEAGIYEHEFQIGSVIKGHKLPIGKFFYAIEYADSRGGTEEVKWIDGALDFAFCTWSWTAEGEFQATPCTLERQAPNDVWWKMTREKDIEGDSMAWGQRLAKYVRDRLFEIETEVSDKTKPLTRARWDELFEYVNGLYAPANSNATFYDKDLPLYRGQVAGLLYENPPKEETGDNEAGEGGNEGGNEGENTGDNKGDGDETGGNKGDSGNTPSNPDDSGDPNKPNTPDNPEKPSNPTPGDSQPTTPNPRPGVSGSGNNSGANNTQKPNIDKDNSQKDESTDKKPVLTPDTSKKPVNIIQNANKTDNTAAGKLVATTVKRVAQAQVGQNTTKTSSEDKEDEKNDQRSVSEDDEQEEKKMTVPALNVADEEATEVEEGGFNWWFVVPIIAVLGVLAAWWTKRALGDNGYKSMK